MIELGFKLGLALFNVPKHALEVSLVALQGLALFGQLLHLLVDLALLLGVGINRRPSGLQGGGFVVQFVALGGQLCSTFFQFGAALVQLGGFVVDPGLALVELMTCRVQFIQLFFKPLGAGVEFLLVGLKLALPLLKGLSLLIKRRLLVFQLAAHGLAKLFKCLLLLDLLLFDELAELGFAVVDRLLHAMQVVLQGLPCPDDRRTILGGTGRV